MKLKVENSSVLTKLFFSNAAEEPYRVEPETINRSPDSAVAAPSKRPTPCSFSSVRIASVTLLFFKIYFGLGKFVCFSHINRLPLPKLPSLTELYNYYALRSSEKSSSFAALL